MKDRKKLIEEFEYLLKEPCFFTDKYISVFTETIRILEQQDEVRKYICKVCGSEWLIEKDEMELCPEPPKVPDDLVEEIYSLFDGENEDMIKEHVVVIIGFICACLGGAFMASCLKSSATNNMVQDIIDRAKAIPEALEEIIQAACDHAFIESSYSEGDYDIDIHKEGEAKIRTILEGM